jgi:hypothetical protein
VEEIFKEKVQAMNQSNHKNKINQSSDNVWQYGTVEPGQPNPHKTYENDGVAPQCAVTGLKWDDDKYGRVRFGGLQKHLNFVDAHLGQNYGWVLGT